MSCPLRPALIIVAGMTRFPFRIAGGGGAADCAAAVDSSRATERGHVPLDSCRSVLADKPQEVSADVNDTTAEGPATKIPINERIIGEVAEIFMLAIVVAEARNQVGFRPFVLLDDVMGSVVVVVLLLLGEKDVPESVMTSAPKIFVCVFSHK